MEKTYMKTEKQIKLRYIIVLRDYAQFCFRDTAGEARKKLKMLHKRGYISYSGIKEQEHAYKYYAYAYSEILNRNLWHDLELYKYSWRELLEELEITEEDWKD